MIKVINEAEENLAEIEKWSKKFVDEIMNDPEIKELSKLPANKYNEKQLILIQLVVIMEKQQLYLILMGMAENFKLKDLMKMKNHIFQKTIVEMEQQFLMKKCQN